jgi:hypothetical protein
LWAQEAFIPGFSHLCVPISTVIDDFLDDLDHFHRTAPQWPQGCRALALRGPSAVKGLLGRRQDDTAAPAQALRKGPGA